MADIGLADTGEGIQDHPLTRAYAILECRTCDNTVLAFGGNDSSITCHGESMERLTDVEMTVKQPDLREVLLQVFDLPKACFDICLCVIGNGPLSASQVADELGYDRTTITRYLNELVDLELLQCSELNRKGGGVVNLYHSTDLERCRQERLIGFYIWAGEVATLIQETYHTKQQESTSDQLVPDVFWETVHKK